MPRCGHDKDSYIDSILCDAESPSFSEPARWMENPKSCLIATPYQIRGEKTPELHLPWLPDPSPCVFLTQRCKTTERGSVV